MKSMKVDIVKNQKLNGIAIVRLLKIRLIFKKNYFLGEKYGQTSTYTIK